MNEKRCKSPLLTDFIKLNQYLFEQESKLKEYSFEQHSKLKEKENTIKLLEDTIINLSNQIEESMTTLINDEIGNIDININPKFKDKIDLTQLNQLTQ